MLFHNLQGLVPEHIHNTLGKGRTNAGNDAGGKIFPDILRRTGQLPLTVFRPKLHAELAVADILPHHKQGFAVLDFSQLAHNRFDGLLRFQLQHNVSISGVEKQYPVHHALQLQGLLLRLRHHIPPLTICSYSFIIHDSVKKINDFPPGEDGSALLRRRAHPPCRPDNAPADGSRRQCPAPVRPVPVLPALPSPVCR